MMTLYLLIERDKIFLYQKNGNNFVSQYIEGNDHVDYELNSIEDNITQVLNFLLDELNLASTNEFDFKIIVDESKFNFVAGKVVKALKSAEISSVEIIDMKPILFRFISSKSEANDDGVNFDGNNYVIVNSELQLRNFSLMGITLNEKDLMKFLLN